MEWAPLSGALPPWSDTEWQRLFALYQKIPQYELLNKGFGIDGFRRIFWLEWAHRLWGRLIGLALILPLLWFLWRRTLPGWLIGRLVGLLVLGGLQGGVGWFMVASGFDADRTAVSPYRLVIHLGLALSLYAALLWTALDVWRLPPSGTYPRILRRMAALSAAMVALTILAGGFVAGLHAGLDYNTFPLMDGQLIPAGYADLTPFIRNLTENIAAVQFDHRVLASLTALVVLATLALCLRDRAAPARGPALAMALVIGMQYCVGVATLLWQVPVALGTAHQAVAVLALTAALTTLHVLRPAKHSEGT